jgi:ubiquinone/menaquinone biosynthesis C-methylase UbiE
MGARLRGVDLIPELLEHARENARIGKLEIDFTEGDAEALPFGDAEFNVVLSQFGHMFAPRPEVSIAEMPRVLKPGGTIAFATWPPGLLVGSSFKLVSGYGYMFPPSPGVSPRCNKPVSLSCASALALSCGTIVITSNAPLARC